MSARRLVIFDLDGTLADTAPDLAAALNAALGDLGRPPLALAMVRTMIGQGARMLVRKGLAATGACDDALAERTIARFLDHYGRAICVGTRPYDDVEAALDTLHAEGALLAICTNKPEALSRALVDALGWSGRFAAIVGGDTLAVRKPDPAPLRHTIALAGGDPVFVGDSITDADTARAAGVRFVAVSFGYRDRDVDALGADAVIDRFADLPDALRRISPSAAP